MKDQSRTATVKVAVAFSVSILGSVAFAVVYATDGSTQLLGVSMAVGLGGLGVGLAVWSKRLMPQGPWSEARDKFPLSEADERETAATYAAGKQTVGRRRLLGRLLAAAGGLVGLAALVPVRSLGPSPPELGETGWASGVRLVDEAGEPIAADDLAVGALVTAFPEGVAHRAEVQVVLIRVGQASVQANPDRVDWAVEGNLAYSRVCTHAGCPVGMFQPDAHLLLCPCHQAAFSVTQAGRTEFGPAPRPLPQLPLDVDADRNLVARSDFPDPVGPDRWRME